jgi:hypothetical protein
MTATQGCQGELEEPESSDGSDSTIVSEESEPADDASAVEGDDSQASGKKPTLGSGNSCFGGTDPFEPNDSLSAAVNAPLGVTTNLSICKGDEDWMRVVVPAGTIARVGIESNLSDGDLDLVIYDDRGRIVGSREGDSYPYSYREQETNTEFFGLYSKKGGAVYHLRVVGYGNAQNSYKLHVDHFDYKDGASCTGAGYSSTDCEGRGANGSGLIPFPFPDPNDSVLGAGSLSPNSAARRNTYSCTGTSSIATSG